MNQYQRTAGMRNGNVRQTRQSSGTTYVQTTSVVQQSPAAQQPPPQQQQQQQHQQVQQQTPKPVAAPITAADGTDSAAAAAGGAKPRPWRIGVKVSAKVLRARRNRRLRKLLTPKNAAAALFELRDEGVDEIQIRQNPMTGQFIAEVNYNGVQYAGYGVSKLAARNNVAEKVLREMVITKMRQLPKTGPLPSSINDSASDGGGDVDMKDSTLNSQDDVDVPIMHLASFALHKLFSEWQEQGYEIPDFKGAGGTSANVGGGGGGGGAGAGNKSVDMQSKLPKPRNELPENPEKYHPVMLLNIMRPGTPYQELGSQGTTPNVVHAIGVTLDGKQFIGSGRSKKTARREAAKSACEAIYGIKFVDEPAGIAGMA